MAEIVRQPQASADSLWEFNLIGGAVVKRSDAALREDFQRSAPPAWIVDVTVSHDRFRDIRAKRHEILRMLDALGVL